MKTHSEMAEAKFMEGYNCAQSVLFSFCDELGLDAETALKAFVRFGEQAWDVRERSVAPYRAGLWYWV